MAGASFVFRSSARVLLVAAAVTLTRAGTSAASDCNLKQIASLDMLNRDQGSVVVTATISGSSHPFLVDTGGVHSELYSDVVEKLGLTSLPMPSNIEIYDLDGNTAKRYVKIPHFSLGPGSGRQLDHGG
jgi:predicted aspartyl protease